MACPRTGRVAAFALALAFALSPAAAHAATPVPNPHDHGFVPALNSNGVPATPPAAGAFSGLSGALGTPPLIYQGGSVASQSTVYAIFWDPSGAPNHFTPGYENLIGQYFTDLAASSGHPTNPNEVSQQYTDTLAGGHRASYSVTYGGSFVDSTPYPSSGQCTAPNGDSVCLNDDSTHNQIQNEVTSFARGHGLPIDLTHIYFLFTPAGVSSCDGTNSCSYTSWCAYHRGTSGGSVPLYSNLPDDAWPGCGSNSSQQPNGATGDGADITLSAVAHEHNETITDPFGNAWFDSSGYEIGDECAYSFGSELGGAAGAQYNQLLNGHPYQIQQEYSNAQAGCISSIPLTANFSGAPTSPVGVGQQVTLNGSPSSETGGTIAKYGWDFGDGSPVVTGTSTSAGHSYAAAGTYTVKLTATDTNGFSDYRTASISVNSGDESPTAAFSVTNAPAVAGQPVGFDGSASNDPDGTISSYSWNFGDGSAAGSGATPSHSYGASGAYSMTLTVTDSSGLTATVTHQVVVNDVPSAAIAVTTVPPVTAQPVAFDGSGSRDPDGSIASYSWTFGDGSAAGSGAKPSHAYAADGTYTVALTVTDSAGLIATTNHQVTVDELPSAAFTVLTSPPAQAQPVFFDGSASTEADGTITSYAWNFGDGSAAGSGAAPSHTYAAAGTYTVTLAVTDSSGMSSVTSHQLAVAGPPTARFSLSPTPASPGQAVTFDGSTSSDPTGTISAYSWNYGDGSAAGSGAKPSHNYAADGTYTITLTVTDSAGLTASTSHQLNVDEPPAGAFALTTATPLQGQPAGFDGSASSDPDGTISTYSWNYGDGSAAGSGAKPSHTYATAGTYTVTLTVTDSSGLTASASHQVTVEELPTAAFALTTASPANGQPVNLDGSASSDPDGTISTYAWNFGDGSATGSGAKPNHTYATAGTYTVTLTVTDSSGLTASASHQVTVHAPPSAAFSITTAPAVKGQPVALDASASSDPGGTISSYAWNYGDGAAAGSGAKPSHTYAAAGTYTVTLTVTDNFGLSAVASHQLAVQSPPSAAFSLSTPAPLKGQPVGFDGSASSYAGGTISSYAWNFGDGSATGSGAKPNHTYAASGVYTVSLTVTASSGLQATATHDVAVAGPPVASFSLTPTHAVPGQSVAFDASTSSDPIGAPSGYTWDFGDGSAAGSGPQPSHRYSDPGIYTVTLTVSDKSGFTDTTSHGITVQAPPIASFSISTAPAVAGQPVAFDGSASNDPTGSISSFAWNFGDGSAAGAGATPSHTYAGGGTYTVSLTVTGSSGRQATTVHQVSVDELPTANVSVRSAHPASGVPVAFDGSASSDPDGTLAYRWNFGDGSAPASGSAPRHTFRRHGEYRVTLVVTDSDGLSAAATVPVRVASGEITRISARAGHRGALLTVALSGPGRLSVGPTTVLVHRPQRIIFKVRASGRQLAELRRRHALTMHVRVEFVPQAGTATRRTATIRLH